MLFTLKESLLRLKRNKNFKVNFLIFLISNLKSYHCAKFHIKISILLQNFLL